MKFSHLIKAAIPAALLISASPVSAKEFIAGISPHTSKEDMVALMEFTNKNLQPGETVGIYDALNSRFICNFEAPDNAAYKQEKAKFRHNAKCIGTLLNLVKSSDSQKEGTINLPSFVRFIGENKPASEATDLIIMGSPLYQVDGPFNMGTGLVPGDGHLFASRANTPYGTTDNPELLKNYRIHFVVTKDGWARNDTHAFHTQRFWSLYITHLTGQMSSWSEDLPTVFDRVLHNAPAAPNNFKADQAEKLEMIQFKPAEMKEESSIYDRPVSNVVASAGEIQSAQRLEIGISWAQEVDVDLYLMLPGKQPIYFGNTTTPEGKHWRDWRESPRASRGYETISMSVPVDLRTAVLAINLFSGNSPAGVDGEIRMAFNGKTYAQKFHISGTAGNKAAGVTETLESKKPANPAWLVIDPLSIAVLR